MKMAGWKWKVMVIPIVVILLAARRSEGAIGINWGRNSAQRLLPSQVVDLLLQNGIKRARIYSAEFDIVSAFAGSGIELSLSMFSATQVDSVAVAQGYVNRSMPFFGACNVTTIFMGGCIFDVKKDASLIDSSMQSLRTLQAALDERYFPDGRTVGSQVKACFPFNELSLKPNITKPSEAEFRDELKPAMLEYLHFIREHDVPFAIETMPHSHMNKFGFNFSFADNRSEVVIEDDVSGAVYTNVFEWTYDCFVWALNKADAGDVRILVSQVGWPTEGFPGADIATAERFYKHLLPLVASDRGTPMRPGKPIDINVHALTDETRMVPAGFTRHWGIYRSNGQPKYKIDLSGQGRDVYPTTVKGIMRMPQRWCVFNGDRRDPYKVSEMVKFACANADCTSTLRGGSCSGLSYVQNVSFVFNIFFQFQFQEEDACDFGGLATISVDDPSTGPCIFPIEVVKGRQRNYVPRPPKGFTGQI